VKVLHARKRHLQANKSELELPTYIYYNNLLFMKEFSIQKDVCVERNTINIEEIIPDSLIIQKDNKQVDITNEFLQQIKKYPLFYDEHASYRKYQGKSEWKAISEAFHSQISIGKLRHYWTVLIKKFYIYEENRDQFNVTIPNEHIFHLMSFVNPKDHSGKDEDVEILESNYEDLNESFDLIEDEEEEHSTNNQEEVEDEAEVVFEQDEYYQESDDNNFEPSPKRQKTVSISSSTTTHVNSKVVDNNSTNLKQQQLSDPPDLDEYDYFGKKVALRLRQMAMKNRNLSRKAEIQVLQVLLDLEDTLDNL
jgi:hypothetical protein